MVEETEWRTRAATPADAVAIATIYNEGIADRVATFETEPRSAAQIAEWFTGRELVVLAESAATEPVAFAASFPYSARPCYAAISEFSVYVARDYRGRGAGRAVLGALIEAAAAAGLHKLTSRVFPENTVSRALLKSLGFTEIGIHRRHGKLDGCWRDCVIVERLLDSDSAGDHAFRVAVPDVSGQENRGDGADQTANPQLPKLSMPVPEVPTIANVMRSDLLHARRLSGEGNLWAPLSTSPSTYTSQSRWISGLSMDHAST
jgi:L-amino acid N-acyltransferase YncA